MERRIAVLSAEIRAYPTPIARCFPEKQQRAILDLCLDAPRLEATPVNEFVDLLVA